MWVPAAIGVAAAAATALEWFSHLSALRWMDPRLGWLLLVPAATAVLAHKAFRSDVENARLETSLEAVRALGEELKHQAFHDSLTKLANRELFIDRVRHGLASRSRDHEPLGVLFLDLDDFKMVNDSLGHAAGDELLIAVAERLRACLRPGDTAARLGGDEFAVLLQDTSTPEGAVRIAERIIEGLEAPFLLEGKEVAVHASLGIAFGTSLHEDADLLLRNADVAMYRAKGRGKGRYAIFAPEMHTAVLQRLETKAELQKAIAGQELSLLYQPIVDLATGTTTGVEAFIRWNHPSRGVLQPNDFVPIAEDTGLIAPLNHWVLAHACSQVRTWQSRYGRKGSLSLSVNLSTRLLHLPALVTDIAEVLSSTGFDPHDLVLDLPQSVLPQHSEVLIERLLGLKRLGIKLALDDFGTGYVSPSLLKRFPIDVVKVDKLFIDSIGRTTEDSEFAVAIMKLATALRLEIVAEGVEIPGQWKELREMRCVMAQGYLFAKPSEAAVVEALLADEGVSAAPVPNDADGTVARL
ncbi:hypothetical protein BH24ACT26_BH24ACT26_21730 [soil metagenome]